MMAGDANVLKRSYNWCEKGNGDFDYMETNLEMKFNVKECHCNGDGREQNETLNTIRIEWGLK